MHLFGVSSESSRTNRGCGWMRCWLRCFFYVFIFLCRKKKLWLKSKEEKMRNERRREGRSWPSRWLCCSISSDLPQSTVYFYITWRKTSIGTSEVSLTWYVMFHSQERLESREQPVHANSSLLGKSPPSPGGALAELTDAKKNVGNRRRTTSNSRNR